MEVGGKSFADVTRGTAPDNNILGMYVAAPVVSASDRAERDGGAADTEVE